jgi:lipase maturation factor 1
MEATADPLPSSGWRVAAWLLPRGVALCFALAFWSWGVQCLDLVGSQGVIPAADFMTAIHQAEARDGKSYFWQLPSLFYWGAPDWALSLACWSGLVFSLIALWRFQALALVLCWVLYLSLAVTGQDFMGFQWDALLLEAGVLAILLSARRASIQPSRVFIFLFHWLLFRLMLLSGIVKLWSGDASWESGTALLVHFETQPLPTSLGWWAHQLPTWLLKAGCWGMYAVELILPLVMWCGRWGRMVACVGYMALMIGIALTGNYNFFNLLTAILALGLLDDSWWPERLKNKLLTETSTPSPPAYVFQYVTAGLLVLLSLIAADLDLSARRVTGKQPLTPEWAADAFQSGVAPWRSINSYGLFQSMTDSRMEIDVEVSTDGTTFHPLKFRYKPDDLDERPLFIAPYQPRLDWQMWFLPFGGGRVPGWFASFLSGLAEGKSGPWNLVDAEATGLDPSSVMASRAVIWKYEFTTPEERAVAGEWWKRSYIGVFTPVVRRQ